MTVTDVTSSTISVQWGSVPCIHQNGDITGYSVQYEVMGSGNTQTMPVSGAGTTQTTISGLTPSTNYSVQVAAESVGGIGVYSNPVFEHTSVLVFFHHYFVPLEMFLQLPLHPLM